MELLRALGALAEDAGPEQRRIAAALGLGEWDAAAHTELFSFALYPYASVYLGAEGMLGGEARDRVAGFWRVLGMLPPEEPDHLTTLLALYAELAERAAAEETPAHRAALERARAAFFWEHVASWLPVYLGKARELAHDGFLRWVELLSETLEAEALALPAAGVLPLHLREAPAFTGTAEAGDEAFVAELLAPARTGFILVRGDLRRIAAALGIALRQGERRYALTALLAQDRATVLHELGALAAASALEHAALPPVWAGIGSFWEQRARAAALLLAR